MEQQELGAMCPSQPENGQTTNSLKVYAEAKALLNTSLVPKGDSIEYGCAISVSVLVKEKSGIALPETVSTATLLRELLSSPFFMEIQSPLAGDIIISATGTSTLQNTPIANGHTGIVGYHGIMSNNSFNGLWQEKFTMDSWRQRYEIAGGYPILFFRAI